MDPRVCEMLSTTRERLQSILACIFVLLRIFDKGKKLVLPSKICKKKEQVPRKAMNRDSLCPLEVQFIFSFC
jgi:hypothetical protein